MPTHPRTTSSRTSLPRQHTSRTLVLDLDNVLIHSDWTRGRGWRTFKRPGADDFIADLAQYFELVVYTSQLPTYADPNSGQAGSASHDPVPPVS